MGSNEEAGDTDELEFIKRNMVRAEETVQEIDAEEERFWEEAVFGVQLEELVDEDATVFPCYMHLGRYIVSVRQSNELEGRNN